jgi:hypothetical protein
METINFTAEALAGLEHWKKSGNTIVLKRINYCKQFRQIHLTVLESRKHLNIIFRVSGQGA